MNRYLKQKDGTWLLPSMGTGLDAFPDDGAAWAAAVEEKFGLAKGALTVVDDAGDPRTGNPLPEPAAAVEPEPPTARDTARAAITAAKDIDSLKAALLDWLG